MFPSLPGMFEAVVVVNCEKDMMNLGNTLTAFNSCAMNFINNGYHLLFTVIEAYSI